MPTALFIEKLNLPTAFERPKAFKNKPFKPTTRMKSKSKKERAHLVYLHATFDPTYRGVYLQREATKGKGEERDGLQGLCKKRSQRV